MKKQCLSSKLKKQPELTHGSVIKFTPFKLPVVTS
jgi:hypothetical protein